MKSNDLYSNYDKDQAKNHRLNRRVVARSLNIPWEDDDTTITTLNGFGWKEMTVIAAALLGTGYLYSGQSSQPADSEYEVLFYDQYDNPIDIPRKSP